jgi:hypothetical protein
MEEFSGLRADLSANLACSHPAPYHGPKPVYIERSNEERAGGRKSRRRSQRERDPCEQELASASLHEASPLWLLLSEAGKCGR